jgi:hypothetical protein
LEANWNVRILLKATKYGHSFALLVPLGMIPDHVKRYDVFEVVLSRKSNPGRDFQLYMTHCPHYRHGYLNLFQLQASHAEQFWVKDVRKYDFGAFSSDYNANPPKELGNTRLTVDDDPRMKVENYVVHLEEGKLRTYQGQVVLDCKLGAGGHVKIAKKLKMFSARLADHYPITSISIKAGGVLLTYQRTDHDRYPHRRIVMRTLDSSRPYGEDERPFLGRFDIESIATGAEGLHVVRADELAMNSITKRLDSAIDIDEFRKVKGDIAEEMVRELLRDLDFDLVADHPLSQGSWNAGSNRIGPDFLVRHRQSGKPYYLEVKWWGDAEKSFRRASKQVIDYLYENPKYLGEEIQGAVTAIVDWEAERPEIRLFVRCVEGTLR